MMTDNLPKGKSMEPSKKAPSIKDNNTTNATENPTRVEIPQHTLEENMAFFKQHYNAEEVNAPAASVNTKSVVAENTTKNTTEKKATLSEEQSYEATPPKLEPFFTLPPELSAEAFIADTAIKTLSAEIDEIGTRTGTVINRSEELTVQHKTHIKKLDEYVKSLENIPWKKAFTYSAAIITVAYMVYKMGMLRAIPNFMSNMISTVPHALAEVEKNVDIPQPSTKDTFHALMETPLSPAIIVSAVGTMTIGLGILKIALWVLRKSPK